MMRRNRPFEQVITALIRNRLFGLIVAASVLGGIGGDKALAQATTVNDLDAQLRAQSEQSTPPAGQSNNFAPGGPSPVGGSSGGIGGVDGVLDQVNGTIDGVIDGVTGQIDGVIDGVTGQIDGVIDSVTQQVMGQIDGIIADVMGPVNAQIDQVLGQVTGVIDETLGNVLGDLGGIVPDLGEVIPDLGGIIPDLGGLGGLGDLFGGGGDDNVESAYDPLESGGNEVAGAKFEVSLPSVTEPYAGMVPIELGALNLPDLGGIRTKFREAAMAGAEAGAPNPELQGADRFSTNPEVLATSLSNEVERQGIRSISESVLSAEGQEAMQQEQEGAKETLDGIMELASDAQELDVTQDIMKNLTAMQAQDSVIGTGLYRQTMETRQQLAANGMAISQASEALDEQQRARRAAQLGSVGQMQVSASLFRMPGMSGDE
ncbi:MAG: hypothetical protein AAGF01_07770 [Cyanobacteria bacterium P01_G01_bin.38]